MNPSNIHFDCFIVPALMLITDDALADYHVASRCALLFLSRHLNKHENIKVTVLDVFCVMIETEVIQL